MKRNYLQYDTNTINLTEHIKSCKLKTNHSKNEYSLDKYCDSNICFFISFLINYIVLAIFFAFYKYKMP